jgi:hypothetical protein
MLKWGVIQRPSLWFLELLSVFTLLGLHSISVVQKESPIQIWLFYYILCS